MKGKCSAVKVISSAILLVAVALPAFMCFAADSSTSMPEMHWRMIGPFRGGRTRAAAGVPDQPNVFYVGQVDGGVWKSTDYGRTWNPIFDGQDTQSVGAIAVAPSDSNVIYVASGEGLHRPDLSVGDGIYRSADAGKTWTHLGLRDGQQIPAIAVDPSDPESALRRGAGASLWPERRTRHLSLAGWRQDLGKGPLQGRKHRRLRYRYRSEESASHLCVDVGCAARTMGRQERLRRHAWRPLQIHGRR